MEGKQAIEFLVNRAYASDMPKGLIGTEAVQYLNNIEEAKKVLLSIVTPPKKK